MKPKAILSNILNPVSRSSFEYLSNHYLITDSSGLITDISATLYDKSLYEVIDYSSNYMLPGLIDLHTHLPQIGIVGKGRGELLDWLNNYTFPEEIKFNNPLYAREKSQQFFRKLIENGTTTAFVYSQVSTEATEIAFQEAEKTGMRVFIGNSLMNMNSPYELQKTTEELIASIHYFYKVWHHKTDLLNYIITPRFAGCCDTELMQICAQLANEFNLKIQTHLSENESELEYIKSLFPNAKSYTELYESCGLIKDNTILAHSIYLSNTELNIIKQSNAAIAHCPCSNRYLSSGIMDLKRYMDLELNIGLGTDIAGGYNFSILQEAVDAIETSKTLSLIKGQSEKILPEEAFYIATLGAAKAVGLNNQIGSLEKGKSADFICLQKSDFSGELNQEELLSEILYNYPGKVESVYVKSKKIY